MQHVVKFSGGTGSWGAAKRVAEGYGTENLTLLFTDTLMEDTDLYRFLAEGACNIFGHRLPEQISTWIRTIPEWHEDRFGRRLMLETLRQDLAEIVPGLNWISEGRDCWEVFNDQNCLGNGRVDPCSEKLKRLLADKWIKTNCDPADTTIHIGIDWTEMHRFDNGDGGGFGPRMAEAGWNSSAPLCVRPWVDKQDLSRLIRAEGIVPPRLTLEGFSHNNCSGFCVKAGQGHYAHLYRLHPARYLVFEAEEEAIRARIGKDVSMMTDRTGDGAKKPLTLKKLRLRIESGLQVDAFEIGGCGCMIAEEGLAA